MWHASGFIHISETCYIFKLISQKWSLLWGCFSQVETSSGSSHGVTWRLPCRSPLRHFARKGREERWESQTLWISAVEWMDLRVFEAHSPKYKQTVESSNGLGVWLTENTSCKSQQKTSFRYCTPKSIVISQISSNPSSMIFIASAWSRPQEVNPEGLLEVWWRFSLETPSETTAICPKT